MLYRKPSRDRRQDRLKNAIEHLGHESDSVRLGGAYELFHLAEDTEGFAPDSARHSLRPYPPDDRRKTNIGKTHKSKPSEEIQSLLDIAVRTETRRFSQISTSICKESYLNAADIRGARLERLILAKADLRWD